MEKLISSVGELEAGDGLGEAADDVVGTAEGDTSVATAGDVVGGGRLTSSVTVLETVVVVGVEGAGSLCEGSGAGSDPVSSGQVLPGSQGSTEQHPVKPLAQTYQARFGGQDVDISMVDVRTWKS